MSALTHDAWRFRCAQWRPRRTEHALCVLLIDANSRARTNAIANRRGAQDRRAETGLSRRGALSRIGPVVAVPWAGGPGPTGQAEPPWAGPTCQNWPVDRAFCTMRVQRSCILQCGDRAFCTMTNCQTCNLRACNVQRALTHCQTRVVTLSMR